MIVIVRVRICPAIIPGSIWGQTRVWPRKAKCDVRVPLSEHAGYSLLRHQKVGAEPLMVARL
jgi:hypothetical protein